MGRYSAGKEAMVNKEPSAIKKSLGYQRDRTVFLGRLFRTAFRCPDRYHRLRLGATATTAMTHIAIQESLDGKAVVWLEKVNNEQYHGK